MVYISYVACVSTKNYSINHTLCIPDDSVVVRSYLSFISCTSPFHFDLNTKTTQNSKTETHCGV